MTMYYSNSFLWLKREIYILLTPSDMHRKIFDQSVTSTSEEKTYMPLNSSLFFYTTKEDRNKVNLILLFARVASTRRVRSTRCRRTRRRRRTMRTRTRSDLRTHNLRGTRATWPKRDVI